MEKKSIKIINSHPKLQDQYVDSNIRPMERDTECLKHPMYQRTPRIYTRKVNDSKFA